MPKEVQSEFFSDLREKDTNRRKFANSIAPQKRVFTLRLTSDKIGILVLVLLVSLIAAFAFGVETGRKQSLVTVEDDLPNRAAVTQDVEINEPALVTAQAIDKTPVVNEDPEIKVTKPYDQEAGKYTIQLIAYKDKAKADLKVHELSEDGVESFIVKRKDWFQVCAGRYNTKKDADRYLKRFAKIYKGCYIRNIEEQ